MKAKPPCVMEAGNRYTGFDVELWEHIAKDLKVEFDYRLTDQWRIFSENKLGAIVLPVAKLRKPIHYS